MTIATTDIAMPAAANVDVGGTVPVRSWMWSTTVIARRPTTPATAIHSIEPIASLGACACACASGRCAGIGSTTGGRYPRASGRATVGFLA